MGGTGPGHKSARARQARLVNMAKARAARKRAPLPWRSGLESRIIEQLVWQWWMEKNSDPSTPLRVNEWLVASGVGKQQQIPRRYAPRNDSVLGQAGGQRNRRASENKALRYKGNRPAFAEARAGKRWAKYRVARLLGVSHTWVNKLVRRFEADPERMRRKMRAFAPASFEKLERSREETRRQRELGWLRGPIRCRRVKVTLEGKKRKVVAVTRAERQRRQKEVDGERARLRQGYGASSGQALREGRVETQRDSASRAGRVNPAPTKASAMPVRYSELPQWARGLLLPGDPGTTTGRAPGTRTPRAVPFAFRRRR